MQRAAEIGMSALSITDHGSLSAHHELLKASIETGVKPILGLEAYFTPDRLDKRSRKDRTPDDQIYNHLIILAKNDRGLRNLSYLSEQAWNDGFYLKPRMDFELLEQNNSDLVVLSGCMNGIIAKAIENGNLSMAKQHALWFKDVFGDDFYMELQPHNPASLNKALLDLADSLNIKSTVTLDCHFASPKDKIAEEIMLILGTHPKIQKESTFEGTKKMKDTMEKLDYLYGERQMSFKDLDIWLMDFADVKTRMEAQGIYRDDLYANSVEISDKVSEYERKENLDLLPVSHSDPNDELEKLSVAGLKDKGLYDKEEYRSRLYEELDIIKSKRFSSYFLVVSNMIKWAKDRGILVGPGRGSSAGSLICYSLGITEVDPIKYGLLFFRFINPERNDFPDIDVDYEDRRRGEVKQHLIDEYKNVASIATFLTFKDKGVVRDVARAFNVPLADVNKAMKNVETWEEFIGSESTREFRLKYPDVVDYSDKLRGRIRGTGVHAAGIVTSRKSLSDIVPIETRKDTQSDNRIPVVAVDMEQAAEIGLIKIDALGLKTLTVIKDTLDIIKDRTGKSIDLSTIAVDDTEVYADLSAGYTKGVFQAEAAPYTNLIVKMGVSNFDELAASNALVRPGAMNTIGADYIKRKKGRQKISYVHPIMEEFTKDTYGCILYQEQVMQACVYLGGMSMAEADKVRKIIGKKQGAQEFDQFKDRFVAGASQHISTAAAEKLWHDFEAHAGYSFNKSHAVAYSLVSYWTAWLKKHYPLEFMYSLLKNENDKDTRTEYLIEAKRMGIRILLPHINESDVDFSLTGNSIRFGLGNIKYVSENIANKIITERPFASYTQFSEIATAKGSGINSRAVAVLNRIGAAAFDDNPRAGNEKEYMYEYLNIPEFNPDVPRYLDAYIKPLEEYDERGSFIILAMVKSIKRGQGWSRVEVVDKTGTAGIFHDEETEIESGKMYIFLVSNNRIAEFVLPEDLKKSDSGFSRYITSSNLPLVNGEYFVVSFSTRKTKKGDKMANVVLAEEDKNLISAVAFPKIYTQARMSLRPGSSANIVMKELDDGTLAINSVEWKSNESG
jgi:DNA polymerase-3 subunit alpha